MKKLRKSQVLLVVLAVVVGACASLVTYGQPDCCSDHGGTYRPCDDPENPYDCGYCTWWAWQGAKETSGTAWVPDGLGDAHLWDDNALKKDPPLPVGKIPLVGAIAASLCAPSSF